MSRREVAVEAHVGDRIVVHSTHQGEPERVGEVLECHEPEGGPPYRVRWEPEGLSGFFSPAGTAAVVHHPGPSRWGSVLMAKGTGTGPAPRPAGKVRNVALVGHAGSGKTTLA